MIKTSIGEFKTQREAINALEEALKKALAPKPKPKTKLLFVLRMTKVGTWNGRWTGEGSIFARTRDVKKHPGCKEGSYRYAWNDGWEAEISVKKVTAQEAAESMKWSEGFLGYDWMIDSILKYGEILDQDEREKREASSNK